MKKKEEKTTKNSCLNFNLKKYDDNIGIIL